MAEADTARDAWAERVLGLALPKGGADPVALRARLAPLAAWVKALPVPPPAALAASMLTAIWHMLRGGTACQDLGPDHFHKRSPEQQAHNPARQIAKPGFACTITPQPDLVSA
jgi:hypothetical protein